MLRVGLYNIAGAIVRLAVAAASIPLLLHALGAEGYGLWAWVLAVVGLVGLAEAGLSTAATVTVAREAAAARGAVLSEVLTVVLVSAIGAATVASAGMWAAAGWLAARSQAVGLQIGEVQAALQIATLVVWTRCVQQVLVGVQHAFGLFGRVNALMTAQVILGTGGLIVAAHHGGSRAMAAWLGASGLGFLLLHADSTRRAVAGLGLRPTWSTARLRSLLGDSGSAWLVAVGTTMFTQGDRLVVGAMLGAAALGVYAAITAAAFQINALSAVAVQPILAARAGRNRDDAGFGQQVEQSVRLNFALALGLGLVLALFAPEVVRVLLPGPLRGDDVAAMRDISVIYALYSVTAVGFYVLQGSGRILDCAIIVLVCGALTLTAIAAGAWLLGLRGAVLGNAGYVLNFALHLTAMSHLGIGWRRWLTWVGVPLLLFVAGMVTATLVSGSIAARLAILIAAEAALAWWTLHHAAPRSAAARAGASA